MAIQHVERWRQISITTVEGFTGLSELQSLLNNKNAPYLECIKLSISMEGGTDHAPKRDGWFVDKTDPKRFQPKILSMGCASLRYCSLNVGASFYLFPPTSNLTSLALDFSETIDLKLPIPWSIFKTILEQSPFLLTLSISDSVIEHPRERASVGAPIVMEHLQQLRLGHLSSLSWNTASPSPPSVFPKFISNLKAPSLQRLSLYGMEFPSQGGFESPFPNLKRIELIECQLTGDAWLNRLAEASPNVTEVLVTREDTDDKIVRWMATGHVHGGEGDADGARCPWVHLRSLVHLPDESICDADELYLKLVATRADRLSHAGVRFSFKIPPWAVDELKAGTRLELDRRADFTIWDFEDEFPVAMWPADRTKGYGRAPGTYYCESESFAVRSFCGSLKDRYNGPEAVVNTY